MIKSGESLEWVIDMLVQGKKIKNIHLTETQEHYIEGKFKTSPSRNSVSPINRSGSRKSISPMRQSYSMSKNTSQMSGTPESRKSTVQSARRQSWMKETKPSPAARSTLLAAQPQYRNGGI